MNSKPLISIIIPMYNAENSIERCVKSILAQTYKNLEIIVINNLSTDSSASIVKKIIKTNETITLIDCNVQGVSFARNTGLKKATGDYVAFIDADDYISKQMFDILVSAYNKKTCDIVAASWIIESDEGQTKCPLMLKGYHEFNDGKQNIDMFCSSSCVKLLNKSIIDKHGLKFDNVKLGEDTLFMLEYMTHAKDIVYLENQFLYYYVNTATSASHMDNVKVIIDNNNKFLNKLTEYEDFLNQNNSQYLLYIQRAYRLIHVVSAICKNKKMLKTKKVAMLESLNNQDCYYIKTDFIKDYMPQFYIEFLKLFNSASYESAIDFILSNNRELG